MLDIIYKKIEENHELINIFYDKRKKYSNDISKTYYNISMIILDLWSEICLLEGLIKEYNNKKNV